MKKRREQFHITLRVLYIPSRSATAHRGFSLILNTVHDRNVLIFCSLSKTHWDHSWAVSQYFFYISVNQKEQAQKPFLLTPHIAKWTHRDAGSRKDSSGPQIPICSVTTQEIADSYCLPCRAVSEQDLKYHLCSVRKLPKSHPQKPQSTEHYKSQPLLEQRFKRITPSSLTAWNSHLNTGICKYLLSKHRPREISFKISQQGQEDTTVMSPIFYW